MIISYCTSSIICSWSIPIVFLFLFLPHCPWSSPLCYLSFISPCSWSAHTLPPHSSTNLHFFFALFHPYKFSSHTHTHTAFFLIAPQLAVSPNVGCCTRCLPPLSTIHTPYVTWVQNHCSFFFHLPSFDQSIPAAIPSCFSSLKVHKSAQTVVYDQLPLYPHD